MAFNSAGQMAGAVSGGCVEGAVVEAAQEVLEGGAPRLLHFGIADEDAWDVGLPCGGEIDVWVERYEPGPFADAARAGERAAQVTQLTDGAKLFVHADEAAANGAEPQLLHFGIADEEAWDVGLPCGGEIDVYVERYEP